jgi:hypothetical protein
MIITAKADSKERFCCFPAPCRNSEFNSAVQKNLVLVFLCDRKLTRQNWKLAYHYFDPERGELSLMSYDITSLELERSVFDSDETRILSAAFEKAWAYVQFDPMLGVLEAWERQAELARCLMTLLKLGDNNPISLANSGIALLHRSQRSA